MPTVYSMCTAHKSCLVLHQVCEADWAGQWPILQRGKFARAPWSSVLLNRRAENLLACELWLPGPARSWEERRGWVLKTNPFQDAGSVPGRVLQWNVRDEYLPWGPEADWRTLWKLMAKGDHHPGAWGIRQATGPEEDPGTL